ncbi:MAG: Unknown protein [uncultured Campylobacterales bacterium]|uniref:Uncharacterized protein n=1 Tax=uncultured Campylobacterales bacterium TaxID=352960 RepID=A0A6S6S909_9BACT|nr:MAG: Unknown protein [uncultured Campylobacterales bacterium]
MRVNNLLGKDRKKQIWVNPTRGFLGDAIEFLADKIGKSVGYQTAIAKDVDRNIKANQGLNIFTHSQANDIVALAAKNNQNGHTYTSFGALMLNSTLHNYFDTTKKVEIFKDPGDSVSYPINIFKPWNWGSHGTKNFEEMGVNYFKQEVTYLKGLKCNRAISSQGWREKVMNYGSKDYFINCAYYTKAGYKRLITVSYTYQASLSEQVNVRMQKDKNYKGKFKDVKDVEMDLKLRMKRFFKNLILTDIDIPRMKKEGLYHQDKDYTISQY